MENAFKINNSGTLYTYPKLNDSIIPSAYPYSAISIDLSSFNDLQFYFKSDGNYKNYINIASGQSVDIARRNNNYITLRATSNKQNSFNNAWTQQLFVMSFYKNNSQVVTTREFTLVFEMLTQGYNYTDIVFFVDNVNHIAFPNEVFARYNAPNLSNNFMLRPLIKPSNTQYSLSDLTNMYEIITDIGYTAQFDYNYKPINYITGNNKTLKLSMIKAENTNHGDSVTDGQTTDIQRFTDATNMRVFCADMVENDVKVLGYTSANNYVTVTKGYVDGNGAYTVTFKYYINGVHQSALDHTARVTSESIPSEPIWTPYYSLLLDLEHSACRPSRIYLNEQTNTVRYNDSENDQNVITDANQSLWFTWLGSGYHTDTTDPYDYGGDSTPDSGDGQWDNSSETIDVPTIPSVSISDTGFVSVFNPTLSQVKALADYMWAGAFDVSLFRKVMANPMDSIIGFALIPCEPTVSGVDTVKVGNIDTGVSMNAVSNQFVDVDCGTLNLEEYWGNYLDYAPYTKITLVLPFIGSVHLSPDDCMKKKIGIKYRIDILSGGCVAYVTCNGSVLYQFTGSCSAQLPITNLDYRGMISALISIGTTAVGVGSAIASGGITAPMVAVGVGNTANNVMNGKPNIQHGGSLGSTSGFLGTRVPYLIITRPRQCVPTGVNKFKGLPSLITSKLKNVTGFTQVHDIHLDDLPCSDAEKSELRSILESGVII